MEPRTRRISPTVLKLRAHRLKRGFTLAESLMASVVLAVTVVAVSGAIVASQKQNMAQEADTTALALARQLMEEIASQPMDDADVTAWPAVTDRTQYDRVSDYAGYTDTVLSPIRRTSDLSSTGTFTTAAPPATAVTSGTISLSNQQYSRQISITYPTSVFGTTVTSGDFALVKVTVRGAGGNSVQLSRLIAKNNVTR